MGKNKDEKIKERIRRNWRSAMILITIATDVLVIAICSVAAYFIRSLIPGIPGYHYYSFMKAAVLFELIFISISLLIGLYRTVQHSNINRHYYLAAKSYAISILIIFSLMYFFRIDNVPRRFAVIFILLLPFVFIAARTYLNRFMLYMRKRGYGNHNVLLAGYDDNAVSIIDRFKSIPELGYEIKGIVTKIAGQVDTTIEINKGSVRRYSLSDAENIMSEFHIDRVFIPSARVITDGYYQLMELCRRKNIKMKVLSERSDYLLRLSHVYDIAGIPLITPKRRRIDAVKRIIKRIFDIVFSLIVLSSMSPVLIIVAISILIEDGLPVLFYQPRALVKGKNIFNIIKFRSMYKNAESMQNDMYELNEVSGGLFRVRNDSRLTKVGKIIRKYSIDEIPQFINVLIGNMSIVGPRPLSVTDLEKINAEDQMMGLYTLRSRGKPGITGLWQISGRRDVGFREMVFLDLYYLENQSLLFDLEIIIATLPVVVFGKGAY